MWNTAVKQLISYSEKKGLTVPEDRTYTINRLLDALGRDSFEDPGEQPDRPLCEILRELTDDAVVRGVIEDGIVSRDLFDTRLTGLLTPRPSEVIAEFRRRFRDDPPEATDWFYRFCGDCNYIRREGSESDCGGRQEKAERVSPLHALPGKRGLRGASHRAGPAESPLYSADAERRRLVFPVFSLRLL